MTVPPPPPGAGPAAPPTLGRLGPAVDPSAPTAASAASQGLVALVTAVVIGLLFHAGDRSADAIWPISTLLAGIGVAVTTDVGRLFQTLSGVVAGVLAMFATGVLVLLVGGGSSPELTVAFVLSVGAFVLGLDWRQARRLRTLTLLTGMAVIPLAGIEQGWAYPAALVWFGLAMAALWSLEADGRAALARAQPIGLVPPSGAGASVDLVRTIGFGLLVGLAAAFLIGNPSCSFRPDVDAIDRLPTDRFPTDGLPNVDPDERVDRTPAGAGEVPPDYRMDGNDQERVFDVDEQGNRSFVDPATGERLRVSDEGGRTVVRDEDGRVVGELDGQGQVAHDGEGSSQRYESDGQGGLVVEGPDGTRYRLDTSGDRPVLRDEDGRVVAEGDADGGHLVLRDPDGDTLVPDPDGDGRIPLPRPGVIDGTVGAGGETTVTNEGDRTVVDDEADGERRTYDQDGQGRDRVTVEGPDGTRIYVYDDRGADPLVLRVDEDGNVIERWRHDPDGILVERNPDGFLRDRGVGGPVGSGDREGGGNDRSDDLDASADPSGDDPAPSPEEHDPFPIAQVLLGLLAAAVAIGAAVWAYRRWGGPTPPEPPWAQRQAARIDAMGAARGQPRTGDRAVVAYTADLVDGPLPDERLTEVGRVVSAALFSRREPTPERRAWVEATLAEIDEAHPAPRRTDALRRSRSAPQPV